MPNPFTSEELAALEADASTPPRAAVTAAVITKDLEARKAKLLRKAPFIRDAVQLDDILESFPVEHRAELREKVKGLVKFSA